MKFLEVSKDGGPESTVDAFFLLEVKKLFSIAVLRFNKGSRNNFHNHAFNALTWFLKGSMEEHCLMEDGSIKVREYKRSLFPKVTTRNNMHKVIAKETSYCLTIRGPWSKTWNEVNPSNGNKITLTHGRKIINVED